MSDPKAPPPEWDPTAPWQPPPTGSTGSTPPVSPPPPGGQPEHEGADNPWAQPPAYGQRLPSGAPSDDVPPYPGVSTPPAAPHHGQYSASEQPPIGGYGQYPPSSGQPDQTGYGQQYSQPYAPQYGQPYPGSAGGYPPFTPSPSRGLAVAALAVGVLSVLGFCIPFLGPLLGVVAVILGVVALGRVRAGRASGRGFAIGGLVTGAIGVVLGIVVVAALLPFLDDLRYCSDLPTADQQRQCVEDTFGQTGTVRTR